MKNTGIFALFIIAGCSSSSPSPNISPSDGGRDTGIADSSIIVDAAMLADLKDVVRSDAMQSVGATDAALPTDTVGSVASDVATGDDQRVAPADADVIALVSDSAKITSDAATSTVVEVLADIPEDRVSAHSDAAPPTDVFTSVPDAIILDALSNADSGPICKAIEGYSLCDNGCCSNKYRNRLDPDGRLLLHTGMLVKPETSSRVYLYYSGSLIPVSPIALLQWGSACNDICLVAVPPSANACVRVSQVADTVLAAHTPTLVYRKEVQIPFRPGTVIVSYGGEKYVPSGQGTSRKLHKLVPPTLADQLFPGTAAARTQVVDASYVAMYTMGTNITAADQYSPSAVCSATFDMNRDADSLVFY